MNKTRKRMLKSRKMSKSRRTRGGAASAEIERESEKRMREQREEESKMSLKDMKIKAEERWLKFKANAEAKGEHPTRKKYDNGEYHWKKPKEPVAKESVKKESDAKEQDAKELTLEARVANGSRSWSRPTPFPTN
jgi:hypothetical protein